MGLCLGFSFLSGIEIIYWFLVRWGILIFKRKKQAAEVQPSTDDKVINVDANIKQTTSKVFDEIFDGKKSDALMVKSAE